MFGILLFARARVHARVTHQLHITTHTHTKHTRAQKRNAAYMHMLASDLCASINARQGEKVYLLFGACHK